MKRFLAIAILLVAAIAEAGSYTVTTGAAQDTRLERHRVRVNKATCQSVNLPANCTQAQARNITPGVDVYSDVSDMINRLIIGGFLNGLKAADTADDAAQAAAAWTAKSDADKNAVCALLGLPNGCEAWPR